MKYMGYLNLLIGYLLLANYCINVNNRYALSSMIFLTIVYGSLAFITFKQNKKGYLPKLYSLIYLIYLSLCFGLSIIFQIHNAETLSILYGAYLLIVPHFMTVIYSLLKKEEI